MKKTADMNNPIDRISRLIENEIAKIKNEMDNIDESIEKDIYRILSEHNRDTGRIEFKDEKDKEKFISKHVEVIKDKKMRSLQQALNKLISLQGSFVTSQIEEYA